MAIEAPPCGAKGKVFVTLRRELWSYLGLYFCVLLYIIQLKLVSITAYYSSPNCSAKAESRRDVETSEEYYRETNALFCQMSYLTALKEGIQQSSCKVNVGDDIHFEKTSPPCKFPEGERHDVRYNCSEDCSRRFLHFLLCTTRPFAGCRSRHLPPASLLVLRGFLDITLPTNRLKP